VDVQQNSTSKEFYAVGPATEDELSASVLYMFVVQGSPDATQIAVHR